MPQIDADNAYYVFASSHAELLLASSLIKLTMRKDLRQSVSSAGDQCRKGISDYEE